MKSPHRLYFEEILRENKKFIKGLTLNVGGGTKPYRELAEKMIVMDLYEKTPSGKKTDLDIKADITKPFPFKTESFETVICTQVLEHILTPQKVLNEIYRVLKQNGNLIFSVPFLERFHPDPKDYWRFTKEGIEELLKKFKIIKTIPVGGRYMWLLTFLYLHRQIPRFIVKLLYPLTKWLTKREKNKEKWTIGFFIVAKKV